MQHPLTKPSIGSCMFAKLQCRMVHLETTHVSMLISLSRANRLSELTESNNHESPVSDGKESGVWVEWNVASWSLWVMVW